MPDVLYITAHVAVHRKRKLPVIEHFVRNLKAIRLVDLDHRNRCQLLSRNEYESADNQGNQNYVEARFKDHLVHGRSAIS